VHLRQKSACITLMDQIALADDYPRRFRNAGRNRHNPA
jgi:hypothetical protein